MIKSSDEFKDFLSSEDHRFMLDSVLYGLAMYRNPAHYSPEATRDHGPRTRAEIRNSHIVAYAARHASDHPHIQHKKAYGRVLFTVRDKLCVSYKMFDKNLKTRSNPTRQARKFKNQQLPLTMEWPPEITTAFCGYRYLDVAQTQFDVYVVCPDGAENRWQYKLSGAEIQDFTPISTSTSEERSLKAQIKRNIQRKDTTETGEREKAGDEPTT